MREGKGSNPAQVWRLEQSKPIHAEATSPDIDFSELIGMQFGMGQSISMASLNVMLDLHFGYATFRSKGRKYRLALRNVRLLLQAENSVVEPGSCYKVELQRGEITQIERTSSTKADTFGVAGDANAKGAVGWKAILPILSGKAQLEGALSTKKDKSSEITKETSTTTQVALVVPAGQDRWLIGCPGRGDPRHENGWLFGDIISASHGETPTPLCVLSSIDQNLPVFVRVLVRADREHFCLSDESNLNLSVDDLIIRFGKINTETLSRRVRAERELRARVAVLAATKKNSTQPNKTLTDSLDLVSLSASFLPYPKSTRHGQ